MNGEEAKRKKYIIVKLKHKIFFKNLLLLLYPRNYLMDFDTTLTNIYILLVTFISKDFINNLLEYIIKYRLSQ